MPIARHAKKRIGVRLRVGGPPKTGGSEVYRNFFLAKSRKFLARIA